MLVGALELAIAIALAAMIGRAAGETDVAPVGAIGALGQLAAASGGTTVSLVGGSIPCGLGSQTAQSLWTYAATRFIGADARPILKAQLLGVVVGALVAVPTYLLLVSTHGVGNEAMPAWAAMAWRATAEAAQGSAAAPPGALLAGVAALLLSIVAARLRTRGNARWVPSPTALAIGMLTPLAFSMAILVGAIAFTIWARRSPAHAGSNATTIAAGCIAGEALIAITLAALQASS